MTHLTKYESSPNFKAMLRRTTTFCLDNPDKRYQTQNLVAENIQKHHGTRANNRKAQLLAGRLGHTDPQKQRVFPWLIPAGAASGWPQEAAARGNAPEQLERPIFDKVSDFVFRFGDWAEFLATSDWSSSAVGVVTGGLLLATQSIGIWQRRKMLHEMRLIGHEDQPDVFPESLTTEEKAEVRKRPVWQVDAASRQGKVRKENQDAHVVLNFGDGPSVVMIFDGAGGIDGGREAAWSAADVSEAYLREVWAAKQKLKAADLLDAIEQARKVAGEKVLSGVTTALLVLLDDDEMHFATLGDGAVSVVWPDGMVGPVQVPHHTAGQPSNIINAFIGGDCDVAPRTGTLRLEVGATVLVMTDGASDLFPFEDFALNRSEYPSVAGLADVFLSQLEGARDPDTNAFLHHDNMTLAIAHLLEVIDHDG